MAKHFLYEEFEKENYYFVFIRNTGGSIPKVVNIANPADYCLVNASVTINGQPQIVAGPECSQKTKTMLQRLVSVVYNSNLGLFIDYDYTEEVKTDVDKD